MGVIGFGVQVQHVLHMGREVGTQLGNAPVLVPLQPAPYPIRALEGALPNSWRFTSRTIKEHLPDPKCIEYIADRFGPYEFVSSESARIARDVWNVFRNDSKVLDCMIHGLRSIDFIRQRQDWSDWKNPYPFGFLANESP